MKADRLYLENQEFQNLAPYASKSKLSKGRQYPESSHPYRTEFQRDRERIIHSRAFRRLEYKTQVFINHEGDHYRTRLTHTIEVAQIARTISRVLRLNEDLAESVALAHDLGHTPFGHAGERQLDRLLQEHGGFEHNRQSLRVIDILEHKYPGFNGINLTWETREGIIKHSSPYDRPELSDFNSAELPSLEAQLIDYADEIAYNNHDLDDGITSQLLNIDEIEELKIWKLASKINSKDIPKEKDKKKDHFIKIIINILVSDLIELTYANINKFKIKSYEDVKNADSKLVGFTDEIRIANDELKEFLRERLYRHHKVALMTMKAQKVIKDLFAIYIEHADILDDKLQEKIKQNGLIETVTDYIAGMTDRFAIDEYKRLTDPFKRV